MDNTGVEFHLVAWDLMIDPNPQDMLSWLDRVGSLMQLCGMNSFDSPKGCNIGDWEGRCEMQGEAA